MKANETILLPLLEGTKQFFVPLFQRPYSWTKREWEVLWEDLDELINEGPDSDNIHFFGSIVTMPAQSVPEGVTKYLLIDGQQRLTTVYIILCLLRNLAREHGGTASSQIEECLLINKYNEDLDHFKLLPTQVDRTAFLALMKGENPDQTAIGQAYRYFQKKIGPADSAFVDTLKRALVKQLMVVSIVLDKAENPYLIFESLNAKGRPLSQADLIRNYVLMRMNVADQEKIFTSHWKPMQDLLGEVLTAFIRHFLMRGGSNIRESDVYYALKKQADPLSPTGVIALVEEMRQFATYYGCLVRPTLEPSPPIRERLQRLNNLEFTTGYPFLLNVYADYAQNVISESDFCQILDALETFILRRLVCNVPSNTIGKLFPPLYGQASASGALVEATKRILSTKNCPTNAEFKDKLLTAKLYGTGDRTAKAKLILTRLEKSYAHREAPALDQVSVEHVLPQTLTDEWKQCLGEEWESIHELLKDTLGNLTLTGYNSTLSNENFDNKKAVYAQSNIQLNKYFAGVNSWDAQAIKVRAETLADKCLEIWPDLVERSCGGITTDDEVTNKRPLSVLLFGQELPVQTWRDVGQKTLEALFELEPDRFAEAAEAYPRFVNTSSSGFRSSRPLKNGYYMETHMNATMFYRYCQQIVDFIGLTSDDWSVKLKAAENN